MMPYGPESSCARELVFLSGVTPPPSTTAIRIARKFDLPSTMREQATLAMENLKKTSRPPAARSPPGVGDAVPDRRGEQTT